MQYLQYAFLSCYVFLIHCLSEILYRERRKVCQKTNFVDINETRDIVKYGRIPRKESFAGVWITWSRVCNRSEWENITGSREL